MFLCACVSVYLLVYVFCVSVYLCVCVPVCLCACMPVCPCVCVCLRMYTHVVWVGWQLVSRKWRIDEAIAMTAGVMDDIPKLPHMFHFSICFGCWGVYKWFQNTFVMGHRTLLCLLGYANCTLHKVVLVLFLRQQLHWNFPSQMIESRSHIIYRKVSNTLALGLSLKPETIVGAGGQVYDHVNTSSLTNGF